MSEENVDVVRRINEAFNGGDFELMYALADPPPEFKFVSSTALGPNLVGAQRGPEGFRRAVEGFSGMSSTIPTSNSTSSSTRGTKWSSRPPSGGVESTAARR
ncbi:MAG TPA: hypothetical protein VF052_02920 [Solirubrobacterales bacterium]